MPEERYNDLVSNGKKIKRLSYLDENGNYIQMDIKLKDEVSVFKLNSFFNEIYKGSRYSYSVLANEIIDFFKSILNDQSVIDLTDLNRIVIATQENGEPNEMLLQFFQHFLEMFENINTIVWTNKEYNMFVTVSQRIPELEDPTFKAEKQAMPANSNIEYLLNEMRNKQILSETINKIKAKAYSPKKNEIKKVV